MQTISFFRGADPLVDIKPDDGASQNKAIMGENTVSITFLDSRFINFQINDYAEIFGERYVVMNPVTVTKQSPVYWKYSMVLRAEGDTLARAQFLFLGSDNTLRDADFSYTGTCKDFLDLVIMNAARLGSGWTAGQYPVTGYKTLTFSAENCFNVLSRIAQEFETEFWVENKTVHFAKFQNDTGFLFRQGKFSGLYEVTRLAVDNSSVATRLYVFGSDKNLPADYRDFSKRLRLPEGDLSIEKNTDKYGVIEYTQIFQDVYPTRTGRVTSINALSPFVFIDGDMDFDVNAELLSGVTAKVAFNTGQLAGYQFQIGKYDAGIKEFTILKNADEREIEIPNAQLKPAIGDEYVLIDMKLPQSYIDAAETRLKAKALEFLDQVSEPQLRYQIVFDPTYLRRKNIVPDVGDLVWIQDEQLELERKIRITSSTRNLTNEWDIKVELSDVISAGKIDIIVSSQVDTNRRVTTIERANQNAPALNNRVVGDLTIEQGTVAIKNIPETATPAGFSELLIENSTGKIYRRF